MSLTHDERLRAGMIAFPKDKPIVIPKFRKFVVATIGRCEWPEGCFSVWCLDPAHIRAKGMGGGRCKDTPFNIIVLCRQHHNFYDHKLGQSRPMQRTLQYWIKHTRSPHEWTLIKREHNRLWKQA